MTLVYPIILVNDGKYFMVSIPDFNINTQGETVAEAITMARDAIGIMGIDMEDDGEELPIPTAIEKLHKENENGIITLVDVDFTEYRRQNDVRTVRRNVTLPSWLNCEAEKSGINVSAVLQRALKQELSIKK